MIEDLNRVKFREEILRCVDCEAQFIFTAGEQDYFLSRGLSTPKRCTQCRTRRKLTLVREEVS